MNRRIIILITMLVSFSFVNAQEDQKSELHKRAESINPSQDIAKARSTYIHAFNDYANRSLTRLGVECAVKATALYYKENYYKEAFDLLHRADLIILESKKTSKEKSGLHYLCTKERMQMYIKLRKGESALDQLRVMENQARESGDEALMNDLLYNKAIYYYTFGQNAQGNAVFKEMADKLTKQKESVI